MSCDHKFVDSTVCLKCGVSFAELKAADAAERANYELMSAIEDASYLTEGEAARYAAEEPPSYTDDVVAVMRDTITAQRELIYQERRLHDEIVARLETELADVRSERLVVANLLRECAEYDFPPTLEVKLANYFHGKAAP